MKTFNGSEDYRTRYLKNLEYYLSKVEGHGEYYAFPQGFPNWFEPLLRQLCGEKPKDKNPSARNAFNLRILKTVPPGRNINRILERLAVLRLLGDIKVLKTMEQTICVIQSLEALKLTLKYLISLLKTEQDRINTEKYLDVATYNVDHLFKGDSTTEGLHTETRKLIWALDSARLMLCTDEIRSILSVNRSAQFKAFVKHSQNPKKSYEHWYAKEIEKEISNLVYLANAASCEEKDLKDLKDTFL